MINEDNLILEWMNTMASEGIESVDTNVLMALRHAIRRYNQDEHKEEKCIKLRNRN